MKYDDYYLCDNIKNLRIINNYSLTYTAKQLHISVKTLKSIEKGYVPKKANPKLSHFASLLFNIPEKTLYVPSQFSTFLFL